MNIDRKNLNRLSQIDPSELSDKISTVSKLLGIDADYISNLIGNPEELQKKLANMNEEDIKSMSKNLDPELLKKLNIGENRNGK